MISQAQDWGAQDRWQSADRSWPVGAGGPPGLAGPSLSAESQPHRMLCSGEGLESKLGKQCECHHPFRVREPCKSPQARLEKGSAVC